MPTQEWLDQYEAKRKYLESTIDLETYFTQSEIAGIAVDLLEVGTLALPSGKIIATDPVNLDDCPPLIQQVPAGRYPATICVVPSDDYGDRYACLRVKITDNKPVRYDNGLTGGEDLTEEISDIEFYGFGVDGGLAAITDAQTQPLYEACRQAMVAAGEIGKWDDPFLGALAESYTVAPKYQRKDGDWVNWSVPDTDNNVIVCASGWGDGYYPVYFGYDEQNNITGIYIHFIDIAQDYAEIEDEED